MRVEPRAQNFPQSRSSATSLSTPRSLCSAPKLPDSTYWFKSKSPRVALNRRGRQRRRARVKFLPDSTFTTVCAPYCSLAETSACPHKPVRPLELPTGHLEHCRPRWAVEPSRVARPKSWPEEAPHAERKPYDQSGGAAACQSSLRHSRVGRRQDDSPLAHQAIRLMGTTGPTFLAEPPGAPRAQRQMAVTPSKQLSRPNVS